jgi:hypothetical protein
MKRYIIICPHKCGSVILKKIISSALSIDIKLDEYFNISTDSEKAELRFSRGLNFNVGESDCLIIIPRNPVSISISMFYSFGYTHPRIEHIHGSKKEFEAMQNSIINQGLDKYVLKKISKECPKMKKLFDLERSYKTILPYELMVDSFSVFLQKLMKALDSSSRFDKTYSQWAKSFDTIEDRSELIEEGKIKPHKRTTDTAEWKKKLSAANLELVLEKYPFIEEYNSFLEQF